MRTAQQNFLGFNNLQTWTVSQSTRKAYLRTLVENGVINATTHSKISKVQVASAPLGFIRSTVSSLANGDLRRVKVAEIIPSRVVLTVYNQPVITAPTKTRSTTKQVTSTASVTAATTAGTPKTTPTTTPTNRSKIRKVKAKTN